MKRTFHALAIAGAIAAAAGCTTEEWTRDQPPQDISAVQGGATRARIDSALGKPRREWDTPRGVHYAIYGYDTGAKGDKASHLLSLITVLTFGLPEIIGLGEDDPRGHKGDPKRTRFVAVSYDANGTVIGVFKDVGEFTPLPDDGVPREP